MWPGGQGSVTSPEALSDSVLYLHSQAKENKPSFKEQEECRVMI